MVSKLLVAEARSAAEAKLPTAWGAFYILPRTVKIVPSPKP